MKHPPRLILCVDQAAKSGWCIVAPTNLARMVGSHVYDIIDHGTATTFAARKTVLEQFLQTMAVHGLTRSDLRVVLEDHSKVPTRFGRGTSTLVGVGKAWGRWEEQAQAHGVPLSHVHGVAPQTWRAAILGSSRGGDAARALAVEQARKLIGVLVGEDEAEAVCIGLWAAGNLERVLRGEPAPKKPRAKKRKAA